MCMYGENISWYEWWQRRTAVRSSPCTQPWEMASSSPGGRNGREYWKHWPSLSQLDLLNSRSVVPSYSCKRPQVTQPYNTTDTTTGGTSKWQLASSNIGIKLKVSHWIKDSGQIEGDKTEISNVVCVDICLLVSTRSCCGDVCVFVMPSAKVWFQVRDQTNSGSWLLCTENCSRIMNTWSPGLRAVPRVGCGSGLPAPCIDHKIFTCLPRFNCEWSVCELQWLLVGHQRNPSLWWSINNCFLTLVEDGQTETWQDAGHWDRLQDPGLQDNNTLQYRLQQETTIKKPQIILRTAPNLSNSTTESQHIEASNSS